jgi:hypothetical protein
MTIHTQQSALANFQERQKHLSQLDQASSAINAIGARIARGEIKPDDVQRSPIAGHKNGYVSYTVPQSPHHRTGEVLLTVNNVGDGTLNAQLAGTKVLVHFRHGELPAANTVAYKLEALWKEARAIALADNMERIDNFERTLKAFLPSCRVGRDQGNIALLHTGDGPSITIQLYRDRQDQYQIAGHVGDVAIRSESFTANKHNGSLITGGVTDYTEVELDQDRKVRLVEMVKQAVGVR